MTEENIDNIFCLIGSFLNRLSETDWIILTKKGYRLNNENDKLIITDKVRGEIVKELSKIYEVREKK